MAMEALPTRVDRLEEMMAELTANVNQLTVEMREYKEESRREIRAYREESRHEMREFREEMREFRHQSQQEMNVLREEMREYKRTSQREIREYRDTSQQEIRVLQETTERQIREYRDTSQQEIRILQETTERQIREYRDISQQEIRALQETTEQQIQDHREASEQGLREMRQSIAEVYQKMGTLAEDLVAPSVPRILESVVDCSAEPEMLGVRMRKRLPDGRSQEYDVVAICDDFLLINETKSRLRPEDVPAFVERLEQVREFFPEYADKRVIGALATFYVDQSLVVHGERQGLIMLGVIGGLLEVLNRAGFEPKMF